MHLSASGEWQKRRAHPVLSQELDTGGCHQVKGGSMLSLANKYFNEEGCFSRGSSSSSRQLPWQVLSSPSLALKRKLVRLVQAWALWYATQEQPVHAYINKRELALAGKQFSSSCTFSRRASLAEVRASVAFEGYGLKPTIGVWGQATQAYEPGESELHKS